MSLERCFPNLGVCLSEWGWIHCPGRRGVKFVSNLNFPGIYDTVVNPVDDVYIKREAEQIKIKLYCLINHILYVIVGKKKLVR